MTDNYQSCEILPCSVTVCDSEGGGRGVLLQVASAGQGVLRGEEVVQKRIVDSDWAPGVGKGRKPGGFSWGDQLFGRPYVVRRGLCKEISPICGFSSFDGFEVATQIPCPESALI